MEAYFEGPDGLYSVELDFSKMSEEELDVYAMMGIADARKELKNRIGYDQFKEPNEFTPEDVEFYENWSKNQRSAEQDKIVEESSDEGSDN